MSGAPRILAFAYACEPGKGSEPGAGWMWARMLARIGPTTVLTRSNNRNSIEDALGATPESDRLDFEYVELPKWVRFWKKGQRGIRLYYLLWQFAALRQARRAHAKERFDLVWHLTLANAWLGTGAAFMRLPLIYGPVGGGVKIPWRMWGALGVRGTLFEVIRFSARGLFRYLNPIARLAWRRSTLILAQNPETRAWFPPRYRGKVQICPNAMVESPPYRVGEEDRDPATAIYAGRLIAWKGTALALAAIKYLPGWKLVICGRGPDEGRLKRLVQQWGLGEAVSFLGWRPRQELMEIMSRSTLFLYPSLHDDAPLVVSEAVAAGLPVICLDRGGPPLLGGIPVPLGDTLTETAISLAKAVNKVAAGEAEAPVDSFDPMLEERFIDLQKLLAESGVMVA